tara:strand:+ start:479 stop:862 length:384 start_codon:yes stop_codon:yes gene_type:complete
MSLSKTPAPRKDRIKGSKMNRKGSAASKSSAKRITFSASLTESIKKKVRNYNSKNPRKRITVATAKAVVRRGLGAFSTSHRPGMSRTQWGLARLNAFMRKKSGSTTANGAVNSRRIKRGYTQDNDLM